MTRLALGSSLVALLALAGCRRDDSKIGQKLDSIEQHLASIDTAIAKIGSGRGAPAGNPGPQRPRPNPKEVYAIDVAGSPVEGNPKAKVTIVEGFEFACPYCRKVGPTIEQLQKDYGDNLRIVKKQFVVHPQVATAPALASCAAHKQGKYVVMEKLLWEKGYDNNRNYSPENIDAIAKEAGLDLAKYKADMDGDCKKQIQVEQAALGMVGTTGTPAFYVNGRHLSGAQPIEQFKAVIDEELKKANERIGKDGLTADNYYQKVVVEQGKKKLEGGG